MEIELWWRLDEYIACWFNVYLYILLKILRFLFWGFFACSLDAFACCVWVCSGMDFGSLLQVASFFVPTSRRHDIDVYVCGICLYTSVLVHANCKVHSTKLPYRASPPVLGHSVMSKAYFKLDGKYNTANVGKHHVEYSEEKFSPFPTPGGLNPCI